MTMYKTLLKIALGFAAAAMLSATALAQSTILVVDTGRVLRDSDVGKHIARQLETIGKSMEAEAKAKASPLESKGKSLEAQLKGQTAQTLQTNTALQQQIKTFREDQQKVAIDLQYKQQEMKITEAKAVQKVQERLRTQMKTVPVTRERLPRKS